MTRDEARKILEEGGDLTARSWTFSKYGWHCHGGCCQSDYDDIDEALESIEGFADWADVREVV